MANDIVIDRSEIICIICLRSCSSIWSHACFCLTWYSSRCPVPYTCYWCHSPHLASSCSLASTSTQPRSWSCWPDWPPWTPVFICTCRITWLSVGLAISRHERWCWRWFPLWSRLSWWGSRRGSWPGTLRTEVDRRILFIRCCCGCSRLAEVGLIWWRLGCPQP